MSWPRLPRLHGLCVGSMPWVCEITNLRLRAVRSEKGPVPRVSRGERGPDFFTVPTVTLQLMYCFFVIEYGQRKILHSTSPTVLLAFGDTARTLAGITRHRTAAWITQVAPA